LRRLVQIIDKKAQFSCFKFRVTEPEGLLRLILAEDYNTMTRAKVQAVEFEALVHGPGFPGQRINAKGEFFGRAKESRLSHGDRLHGDRRNTQ
jgi:hypothetical protein